MASRGSYVHNSMVEFSGASRNFVSFMQFSQKIDGFRQKFSQGLLELVQLYKQNPLEKFFISTIYQNYTLALIVIIYLLLEDIINLFAYIESKNVKDDVGY